MTNRTLLLIVALAVLHLILHVGIGLGRGAPDLAALAVLIASRSMAMGPAAALGFGLGLLEDAFSVLSFGANAFAMAVIGIVGSRSRDIFVGDSMLFLLTYFGVGKWIRDLLAWMVSESTTRPDFTGHILVEAPFVAVYLGVVGLLVVRLSTEAGERTE